MQQWRDGEGMTYVMNRAQGRLNNASQSLAEEEAEALNKPPQPNLMDLAYARGDAITLSEHVRTLTHEMPTLTPDLRVRIYARDPMPNCYGADPDPRALARPEPFVVDEFDDDDGGDGQPSQNALSTAPTQSHLHSTMLDTQAVSSADDTPVPWLLPLPRLPRQPSLEHPPRAPDGRRIFKRTKRGALIPIEMDNHVDAEVAEELMFHVYRFCVAQGSVFLPMRQMEGIRDIWDALVELKKGIRMPISPEDCARDMEEWEQRLREARLKERGLIPS